MTDEQLAAIVAAAIKQAVTPLQAELASLRAKQADSDTDSNKKNKYAENAEKLIASFKQKGEQPF